MQAWLRGTSVLRELRAKLWAASRIQKWWRHFRDLVVRARAVDAAESVRHGRPTLRKTRQMRWVDDDAGVGRRVTVHPRRNSYLFVRESATSLVRGRAPSSPAKSLSAVSEGLPSPGGPLSPGGALSPATPLSDGGLLGGGDGDGSALGRAARPRPCGGSAAAGSPPSMAAGGPAGVEADATSARDKRAAVAGGGAAAVM